MLAEYYQDDLIKKARAAVTPTGTTSYSVVPSNTMNRGKSIPVVVGGSAGGVGNSGRGSNVGVADAVASNSGKKSAVTGPQVDDLDKRAVDTLSPTFSPLNELSGFVDTRDNSSDMSIGGGYTPFSSRAALTAFLCPACITSVATSVSDYFTSFCNTNWSTTFLVIEIIVTRSFLSLWFRKKLILAALVLHVLMACFLGWVLGPSGDQIYNLTSFFAIGTLLLYFANIQLVYYMFTSHQVS